MFRKPFKYNNVILIATLFSVLGTIYIYYSHTQYEDLRRDMWRGGIGTDCAACIRSYAKEGVNINDRGTDGQTLLIAAARFGKPEAVKTLIELGANINARDNKGDTALKIALRDGNKNILRILRSFHARQ